MVSNLSTSIFLVFWFSVGFWLNLGGADTTISFFFFLPTYIPLTITTTLIFYIFLVFNRSHMTFRIHQLRILLYYIKETYEDLEDSNEEEH